MKTIDLRESTTTLEELLQMASSENLLIRDKNGREFILDAADDFDREVAQLGKSDKFMAFLEARSHEPGSISLEEIDRQL